MIEPNQILEQALTLSEDQRAAIAASLLQSLDAEIDPESETHWDAEIKRRLDEIDNGTVELIPWSEIRSKIQKIRNEN
jgi:putative addiction module component (TIGR02574 family)